MILFVFEGSKEEPKVYRTLKSLYFEGSEDITYIFNSNIYGLYNRIKKEYSDFENIDDAADIVSVLKELYPDSALKDINVSSDIDQIFLFFDYDMQHAYHVQKQHPEQSLEEIVKEDNDRLKEMLSFFNEETRMGKLFISYPMIEALKYTKKLPDPDFLTYKVSLEDCHRKFKGMAEQFTDYHSGFGLLLDDDINEGVVKHNWEMLKEQNVKKANYICNGANVLPLRKDLISQDYVFASQQLTYTKEGNIYILGSFPLFLYEYFK